MATMILHNHSCMGDDVLDLSGVIVASFMFLQWYMLFSWCDYSKDELPYGHRSVSVWKSVV
jgi:hypothetical protein